MIGERTEGALARIQAALSRIETATEGAGSAAVAANQRHERLRSAVAETLRDLDLLIGEGRE